MLVLNLYISGKAKRTQPKWEEPDGSCRTGLKLYNSLTRQKVGLIQYIFCS